MKAEVVKRILLGVAIMVLVIIWSRNLLLFFPHEEKVKSDKLTSTPVASSERIEATNHSESKFVFADDVRDPFQIPRPKSTSSESAKKKLLAPPPPEPPHASLIGIVWNTKSPQVVVFDSLTHGSVILCERQSINGYQIRSISKTQVVMQYKRQRIVWKANE